MTGSPSEAIQSKSHGELVPLTAQDLPDLARLIAAQSGRPPAAVDAHLRWFLLENPARDAAGAPLGWGLRSRSSGLLAGCILCVPQVFRYRDRTLTVMGSSSFYVDADHRGGGGLVFLKFSQLGGRWPLFGNSANAEAAALWKARGAAPIPDSDHELLGVIRWKPVVEEVVARKLGGGSLSRLAGGAIAPAASLIRQLRLGGGGEVELALLTSAEQVMTLPLRSSSEKLTADRNLDYIRWRYYSGRDATAELYAARGRQWKNDVLVVVNQRPRGDRGQIRTLFVLDVYPEVLPGDGLAIARALVARYRERIDTIVLRGFDSSWQRAFQAAGFVRRQFAAPNGWFLDRGGLLPTRHWYTVPADGDWII